MYCPFCGKELSGEYKFCNYCGAQLITPEQPKPNVWLKVLCCALGVILILCGIMPFLMQSDFAEYRHYLERFYSKQSFDTVLAASAIQSFAALLPSFLYFPASLLAVLAGLLLIKREKTSTFALLSCAAVNLVSIVSSFLSNLLVFAVPGAVISIYTNEEDAISAGVELIASDPRFLYYYQEEALRRIVFSVFAIAISLLFVLLKQKLAAGGALKESKLSSYGSVMMILSLSVLAFLKNNVSFYLISQFFGSDAMMAHSLANQPFSEYFKPVCIYLFILILAVSVLFHRVKRWILAIPTVSIVTLLGAVAFIATKPILVDAQIPSSMIPAVYNNLIASIISSVLIFIAVFFWFSSVSRSSIPAFLQFALPIAIPILAIAFEFLFKVLIRWATHIPFSIILIALITLLVSVLIDCSKQKAPK